jgi:hypothetical protein
MGFSLKPICLAPRPCEIKYLSSKSNNKNYIMAKNPSSHPSFIILSDVGKVASPIRRYLFFRLIRFVGSNNKAYTRGLWARSPVYLKRPPLAILNTYYVLTRATWSSSDGQVKINLNSFGTLPRGGFCLFFPWIHAPPLALNFERRRRYLSIHIISDSGNVNMHNFCKVLGHVIELSVKITLSTDERGPTPRGRDILRMSLGSANSPPQQSTMCILFPNSCFVSTISARSYLSRHS